MKKIKDVNFQSKSLNMEIEKILEVCSNEHLKNVVLPQLIDYATDVLAKIDFMPVGSYRITEITTFLNNTYRHKAHELKKIAEANNENDLLTEGPLWIREYRRVINIVEGKVHFKISVFKLFKAIKEIETYLALNEEQLFYWTVPEVLPCVAEYRVTFPPYATMKGVANIASGVYAHDGMYDLIFRLRECVITCGFPKTNKHEVECVSHDSTNSAPDLLCWFAPSYLERMYDDCIVTLYCESNDPTEWGISYPVRVTIEKDGFVIPMAAQLQIEQNPEHINLTL